MKKMKIYVYEHDHKVKCGNACHGFVYVQKIGFFIHSELLRGRSLVMSTKNDILDPFCQKVVKYIEKFNKECHKTSETLPPKFWTS